MAKSKKKRQKKKQEKTTPVSFWEWIKSVAVGISIACGLALLISVPSMIFHLITKNYFPIPEENILWKSVGYLGTVIIGVVSLIAAVRGIAYKFCEEKPSQKFYIGVYAGITAGVCVLLFGCFLMYGSFFSEEAVTVYFLNLILILILGLSYLMSRGAIDSWIRLRGRSKTFIRKHKKGIKNYWLYEELHKELNLGVMYHLNKWFVILYPITFTLMFTLGCLRFVTYITAILFTVLCLVMIVTISFSDKVDCTKEDYKISVSFLHILSFRIIVPIYIILLIVLEWLEVFGLNPIAVITDFVGGF